MRGEGRNSIAIILQQTDIGTHNKALRRVVVMADAVDIKFGCVLAVAVHIVSHDVHHFIHLIPSPLVGFQKIVWIFQVVGFHQRL